VIDEHSYDGLPVQAGDIICTQNGQPRSLAGQFWYAVGRLVPGEIDHVAVYVGPGGRLVEAGARGVIAYTMAGDTWDAFKLRQERALRDTLIGVAYPLLGLGLSLDEETRIREDVAEFCLAQAAAGKPYNPIYPLAETDAWFYCSQLAYRAYQAHGIDLNCNRGVPRGPGLNQIVFPEEIWQACPHRRVGGSIETPDDAVGRSATPSAAGRVGQALP
jgi:hypothetical protein